MSALLAPAAPLPQLKMRCWWLSADAQIGFQQGAIGAGWRIDPSPQATSQTRKIIQSVYQRNPGGFATRRAACEAVSCEIEKIDEELGEITPLIALNNGWWVTGWPYVLAPHEIHSGARAGWRIGTMMGAKNPEKQAFDVVFAGVLFPTRRAALEELVAWRKAYLHELDSA